MSFIKVVDPFYLSTDPVAGVAINLLVQDLPPQSLPRAAQWQVSPCALVEQVAVPVSDGQLHVPFCSMAWLGGPLGLA